MKRCNYCSGTVGQFVDISSSGYHTAATGYHIANCEQSIGGDRLRECTLWVASNVRCDVARFVIIISRLRDSMAELVRCADRLGRVSVVRRPPMGDGRDGALHRPPGASYCIVLIP